MSNSDWASNRYRSYGYRSPEPPKKKRKSRLGRVILGLFLLAGAVILYMWIVIPGKVSAPEGNKGLTVDQKKLEEERKARHAAKVAAANQELQATLDSWVSAHPTYGWSIIVKGLDSDERLAQVKPDEVMRAASLYKLFLLPALFRDLSVDQLASTYASGSSLDHCLDLMLRISDNACGEVIGEYLGWSSADGILRDAGYSATKLNVQAPVTTAAETTRLLSEIYDKKAPFNDASKQYILSKLAQQSWNKGIPAGCAGCKTYNKTGDLGFVRHDTAIIAGPGGAYVLTIFSDGATYADIAELTGQINALMIKPIDKPN
jgi:beta-lactamase class A